MYNLYPHLQLSCCMQYRAITECVITRPPTGLLGSVSISDKTPCRQVLQPRDLYLELYDRCKIWQAPRQQCCGCACQISKWWDNLNYQSRGFETSRDLTIRHIIRYWNWALVPSVVYAWRSYGDAFRITDPLCGEFVPPKRTNNARLWYFIWF